jgi:hypothetical protein
MVYFLSTQTFILTLDARPDLYVISAVNDIAQDNVV